MKQRFILIATAIVVLAVRGPAAAVGYVDSPPMSKVLGAAKVSACGDAEPTSVPLITWGGDIATIHANGASRDTAAGSVFAEHGLRLKLFREDVLARQVEAYLSCKTPYLRGTLGMINMAAEVTGKDERTQMLPIYQMTWSAGGDALVVKEGIRSPKDLKGKTIVAQAYGPHVDYLTTVLEDAGLTTKDVKLKWVKDLVGLEGDAPAKAFHDDPSIDAAFVIIPDALAVTSNGTVGTGAEDSVRGATILLSTKTANRVIADLYVVRRDYFDAHREKVEAFVHGLMVGEEKLRELVRNKTAKAEPYRKTIAASAEILLDSADAVGDTEGMLADAEFAGWKGNVKFFGDPNYPRNMEKLNDEAQVSFQALGLLSKKIPMDHARWDYEKLKRELTDTAGVEAPRFDSKAVAQVIARKQQQGTLQQGELFAFQVYFRPNQTDFSADLYGEAFEKVISLASTYGGALISVEGHSDPLGILKAKKEGKPDLVVTQMKQSAKNLSLSRANAVRDSVVDYAKKKGVTLDTTQFAIVGHGIARPQSGLCGADPCAPKSEQEWLNNMRVEFRIIQVEAEASVFKPL